MTGQPDNPREVFWLYAEPAYDKVDDLTRARLNAALDAALEAATVLPAGCSHAICLPLAGDGCQFDGGGDPGGHADHPRRQLAEAHARLAVVTRDRDTFREVARSNQRYNAVLVELVERVQAFADELPTIHGERLRGLLSAPTTAERAGAVPEPTPNPARAG